MELSERLAMERRARLAAERLLALRTRELATAEERLAKHSRGLIPIPRRAIVQDSSCGTATFIRAQQVRALHPEARPVPAPLPAAPLPAAPLPAAATTAAAPQPALQPAPPSDLLAGLPSAPRRPDLPTSQYRVPPHGGASPPPDISSVTPPPVPAAARDRASDTAPVSQPEPARPMLLAPTPYPTVGSEAEAGPDLWHLQRTALPSAETPARDCSWPVLDDLPDGLAIFDVALRLLNANRRFCTVFGLAGPVPEKALAALLGTAIQRGLIRIDGSSVKDWLAGLACLATEPAPDLMLQLADDSWIRLAAIRNQTGQTLCHLVDITRQMRIWAAIEAIPDGFVLFDKEDRMVICNQSYRDIYKTSAPVMKVGVSFEEILRYGLAQGEYPEAHGREETWVSARMTEHLGPAAEGEHQLKDGRWLRSIDKATPDGGRVGLRVDITQLRIQASALEAARLAAEAANRAKSAFLANMSHEIRTPMNGVIGMAELLCDTALSDEQHLFAETIRSSGEALLVIINDILDYSKIEAERLTLRPEDFDFERTIHEVVMLLQPRAREKGIDLMIDYDVFLPTRFTGDPGRLRQVLTNLIGNAVKFTAKGHVLTRVVGMEIEDGHLQLHVTVEDTGIGIPADLLDHVFGEFYQVDDEQNRKFEGTGLGLAITRRLIERMDGAVWVDSEQGKGSVFGFRLSLPLAEGAGPEKLPVAIGSAMVVDDQFINRTILERQLVPCGIDVSLCRSGRDALHRISTGAEPDVVLVDHEMPGMDGVALAKKLRETGYKKPVVLLSSSPLEAREAGGDAISAILQKPVLRAGLYRLLTSLTEPVTPKPALSAAQPTVPQTLRAMRILAAEDNRTNQLVLQKMLRTLDIELRFAGNGHEAVVQWREFRPDLIFMDISMPGMDGREATKAIRAAEVAQGAPRVPIVALTAHAMEGDAEGILAAGMDRYLTKPLRKSEICSAVTGFSAAGCRPPDPGQPS